MKKNTCSLIFLIFIISSLQVLADSRTITKTTCVFEQDTACYDDPIEGCFSSATESVVCATYNPDHPTDPCIPPNPVNSLHCKEDTSKTPKCGLYETRVATCTPQTEYFCPCYCDISAFHSPVANVSPAIDSNAACPIHPDTEVEIKVGDPCEYTYYNGSGELVSGTSTIACTSNPLGGSGNDIIE